MEAIQRLVPPMGYCFATNLVAKRRNKVRFMYRELPDRQNDSGWRFFNGTEDQAYVDDPSNLAFYDVNTIAEIDPDIIPFLDHQPPCAFERIAYRGPFKASEYYGFTSEE